MSALRKPYHPTPRGNNYSHQNALNQNRKITHTNANNSFAIMKARCVHSFEGQCQKIITELVLNSLIYAKFTF